jgi:hypothetical protein
VVFLDPIEEPVGEAFSPAERIDALDCMIADEVLQNIYRGRETLRFHDTAQSRLALWPCPARSCDNKIWSRSRATGAEARRWNGLKKIMPLSA